MLTISTNEQEAQSSDASAESPEVAALVERAIARDQAAFAALYDRCLERVYRYVFFRVGSREDAEDVAEMVFLKAWEAIDRYQPRGRPFIAWLFRLAHNATVDHLRKRRPADSLSDDERPIDVPDTRSAAAFDQRLDADQLAAGIAGLTGEQQQVIVLRFVDGLGTAEIATLLDKREGAIRAVQMRALQSLRQRLESAGDEW